MSYTRHSKRRTGGHKSCSTHSMLSSTWAVLMYSCAMTGLPGLSVFKAPGEWKKEELRKGINTEPAPPEIIVDTQSEMGSNAVADSRAEGDHATLRGSSEARRRRSAPWSFGYRNWTFPEVIVPQTACRGGSFNSDRVAIATYITSVSKSYLRVLQRWFLAANHAHPELDKVIVIPPGRTFKGRDLLNRFVTTFQQGARLSVEQLTTTPGAGDLSEHIRDVAKLNDNCCGWKELQKIAVWTMTKYNSILLLDTDIVMLRPVPELFQCGDSHDFLSAAGSAVALNGGMQWLRPSLDTYRGLLAGLAAAKGPAQYCNDAGKDGKTCQLGWWGTGRLLSKQFSCETPSAEKMRDEKGPLDFNCEMPWHCKHDGECRKGSSSYGMETNQGYLFYFFHINAQRKELAGRLRAAQVNPCVYDLIVSAWDSIVGGCVDSSGSHFNDIIGNDLPGVKILHKYGRWRNPLRGVADKATAKALQGIKCCPQCMSYIAHEHKFLCKEPKFV